MATRRSFPRHPLDEERIANSCANHSLYAISHGVRLWRTKWEMEGAEDLAIHLIMETDKASINRSDDYVLNNICDQIYAADIKTIGLYLEFFNIIEIYFEKYKETSKIKKSIEKKLYLFYKILIKSPRKDNKALKVFKVYKFLSKNLGSYVPFFCSVPVHLTSKFKPTLYSYIIEARNIDTKELNLKYTLNRG